MDRTERMSLLDIAAIKGDLMDLLDVDVVTPPMLSKYCREHVLSEARPL